MRNMLHSNGKSKPPFEPQIQPRRHSRLRRSDWPAVARFSPDAEHPVQPLDEPIDLHDLNGRVVDDSVPRPKGEPKIEHNLALEPAECPTDGHVLLRLWVKLSNTTELPPQYRVVLNEQLERVDVLRLQTEFEKFDEAHLP